MCKCKKISFCSNQLSNSIREKIKRYSNIIHFIIFLTSLIIDVSFSIHKYVSDSKKSETNSGDFEILSSDMLAFYFLNIERIEYIILRMIIWLLNKFSSESKVVLIGFKCIKI